MEQIRSDMIHLVTDDLDIFKTNLINNKSYNLLSNDNLNEILLRMCRFTGCLISSLKIIKTRN
jgi:hypothetical protein